MLDEIFVAGAFDARGFDQFADDIPLMIAEEDHRFLLILSAVPVLLFLDFEGHAVGRPACIPTSAPA